MTNFSRGENTVSNFFFRSTSVLAIAFSLSVAPEPTLAGKEGPVEVLGAPTAHKIPGFHPKTYYNSNKALVEYDHALDHPGHALDLRSEKGITWLREHFNKKAEEGFFLRSDPRTPEALNPTQYHMYNDDQLRSAAKASGVVPDKNDDKWGTEHWFKYALFIQDHAVRSVWTLLKKVPEKFFPGFLAISRQRKGQASAQTCNQIGGEVNFRSKVICF